MKRDRERQPTPKQEAFCYNIVEGDNPSEAYRAAYNARNMSNEAVSVEAARLLRLKKVRERVAELRESLQRSLGVSRATLMREINEVMNVARGGKNAKAMLNCVMAKAKILGFLEAPGRPTSPVERRQPFDIFEADGAE